MTTKSEEKTKYTIQPKRVKTLKVNRKYLSSKYEAFRLEMKSSKYVNKAMYMLIQISLTPRRVFKRASSNQKMTHKRRGISLH